MTDIEFEQILHRMSKEDLDKWNRLKELPFDSVAIALACESRPNLAPPFDEYLNHTGSLNESNKDLLQRYRHC